MRASVSLNQERRKEKGTDFKLLLLKVIVQVKSSQSLTRD
jgi:hypothetical protein